jgi:hypothetical protein
MKGNGLFRSKFNALVLVLASSLVLMATGCDDDDDDDPIIDVGVDVVDDVEDDVADDVEDDAVDDVDEDAIDGPSARLQIIHEAPDPELELVDVYLDGEIWVDDLRFREATGFRQLEADTTVTIEVAPADSTSVDDSIVQFDSVNLADEGRYAAIIHGVQDPQDQPPAPDDRDLNVALEVRDDVRLEPDNPQVDEVIAFHAGADVPAVDVIVNRSIEAIEDLGYAEFSDYLELPNGEHTLDVNNAQTDETIASFQTPDMTGGSTFIVVASGFLETEDSQRPELGLFAYPTAGGEGIELMRAGRLQVAHNSPDPGVGPVDVYVDDELIAADIAFQEATGFVSFVSETDLEVAVTAAGASIDDAVLTTTTELAEGGSSLAAVIGVSEPADFVANPDGADIGLQLAVGPTRERAVNGDQVQVEAFHGVTDAPRVDVVVVDNGQDVLIEDLGYGEFSESLSIDPQSLQLRITQAGQQQALATFTIDLSDAQGQAYSLVASGFVAPNAQPSVEDAEFSILAITADGGVTVLKPGQ